MQNFDISAEMENEIYYAIAPGVWSLIDIDVDGPVWSTVRREIDFDTYHVRMAIERIF
jgi:hypothetical protein